jgi:hypothetical protein
MFQIYADEEGKFQKNNPQWHCQAGGKYRYKAEVDPDLTYTDIQVIGRDLCFNILPFHFTHQYWLQASPYSWEILDTTFLPITASSTLTTY